MNNLGSPGLAADVDLAAIVTGYPAQVSIEQALKLPCFPTRETVYRLIDRIVNLVRTNTGSNPVEQSAESANADHIWVQKHNRPRIFSCRPEGINRIKRRDEGLDAFSNRPVRKSNNANLDA
jgi:hypothetical protein